MATKGRSNKKQKVDCKENVGIDFSLPGGVWVWHQVRDES